MNKIHKLITALLASVILPCIASGNPIVKLAVSETTIVVGQTFNVDVFAPGYVDETNSGGDLYGGLLSFGFDTGWGSLLRFNGATVPVLDDDSAFTDHGAVGHVAGSAFPASSEMNLLLAQLSFTALGAGTDRVSVSGVVDGFHGLYYESFEEVDVEAVLAITITSEGPHPVPEGAPSIWLVAGALVYMSSCARKRLS